MEQSEKEEIDLEAIRLSSGENVLLYGVPGSGKSWTIEHEYCKPEVLLKDLFSTQTILIQILSGRFFLQLQKMDR